MKKTVGYIHLILCAAMLVAIVAEFLFAGMGVFHATSFAIHKDTGEAITYASCLLFILSLVGLLGRARIGLSALIFVLMIIQNLLLHMHQPYVAALHPLNGLAIMGATAALLRIEARQLRG